MTAVEPTIAELKPSSKKKFFDHTDSVAEMKERISSQRIEFMQETSIQPMYHGLV